MVLFNLIVVLGLWLPGRSGGTSIAFAVLFGIGSGACIGLGPVLIMSISPMNEVGYRMGAVFAIAGIGSLTGPPIGGAIVDATRDDDYEFAAVFSGVNYFISLVVLVWLMVRLAPRIP